jgi:hypothetical protein
VTKNRMFSFITKTWNPIAMHCLHECYKGGCWAEILKRERLKESPRYRDLSQPKLIEKELRKTFHAGDYVFVEDMGDLFGDWIPKEWIEEVLKTIWAADPKAKFLLLTKNPWRMVEFQRNIPVSCLCGCTIETTKSTKAWSKAPAPQTRCRAMRELDHPHKAVIIEPIMDFNSMKFLCWIEQIKPELVVIGYDNYDNHLPEPSLAKTKKFIDCLKYEHFNVQSKSLREKWNG